MWNTIGRVLTGIARWCWHYPLGAAFIILVMMFVVDPNAFWNLVATVAFVGLIFQGLIRLGGYGSLWGKRKKDG